MRTFILLFAVIILASCKKEYNTTIVVNQATQPPTGMHFIYHWGNATLRCFKNNYADSAVDSMQSYQSYDTSYVIYKNEKLFVWSYDSLWNSAAAYYNRCWIGKTAFDTTTAYSTCGASPSIWFDDNGNQWHKSNIYLNIDNMAHFDFSAGSHGYTSQN